LLKEREKSRVHGAIGFGFGFGFGFASHWLKNCHESFKPIIKRSNHNHVITFDSHLKTALTCNLLKAREKSRPHGSIGSGFGFHRLKNWREILELITKRRNRNHEITFDSI